MGSEPAMDDPLVSANPDYFLYAICEEFGGCGRGVQLDRKALLERYGPDLRCSELRSRLVCSSCGIAAQDSASAMVDHYRGRSVEVARRLPTRLGIRHVWPLPIRSEEQPS